MPPKKKLQSSSGKEDAGGAGTADSPTLPLAKELYILSKYAGCQSVGVDEAGRGPLAGPVVAAAVALLDLTESSIPPLSGVRDSKTVGEDEREALFDKLIDSKALVYGVSVIDRDVIDDINIFQATMRGMEQAVAQVQAKLAAAKRASPLYVLIDGPKVPAGIEHAVNEWVAHEGSGSSSSSSGAGAGAGAMPEPPSSAIGMKVAEAVIKGDSKVYSIAAASLIAKVTRDRIMRKLAEQYPDYGFEVHKGYGVPAHVAAIFKHGPCPAHRRSFRPVKDMVAQELEGGGTTGKSTGSGAVRGKSTGSGAARGKSTGSGAVTGKSTGSGATRGKPASAAKGKVTGAAAAAAAGAGDVHEGDDAVVVGGAGAGAGGARGKRAAGSGAVARGRKPAAAAADSAAFKAEAATAAIAAPEAAAQHVESSAAGEAKTAAASRGGRSRTATRTAPAAAAAGSAAKDASAAAASLTGRKRRAPAAAAAVAAAVLATAGADPEEAAAPASVAKRGRRAAAATAK